MFKRLSSECYRLLNLKILITATLIFILFIVLALPQVAEHSKTILGSDHSPDTSFIYSVEDLYTMAGVYGAEGRMYYIKLRYTFDLVWPIVYLLFLVSYLTIVFRPLEIRISWKMINLLPFGAVLLDFMENIAASIVMYRYPLRSPVIAELAPIFTFLKWSLISASFCAIIVGMCLLVIQNKKLDSI